MSDKPNETRRKMVLPPNYNETHWENELCAKAGCWPVPEPTPPEGEAAPEQEEPYIIVREGHKRKCASNLRIAITQNMNAGFGSAPLQDGKPVYCAIPPCNCGAEPPVVSTAAPELGQHFAKIHMREQEEADSLRVAPESYKPAEGAKERTWKFADWPKQLNAIMHAPADYSLESSDGYALHFSDKELVSLAKGELQIIPLKNLPLSTTPVTVEAPERETQKARKHIAALLVGIWPEDGFDTVEDVQAELKRLRANPKAIGDVEEVADKVVRAVWGTGIDCVYAEHIESAKSEVAAILSPFFTPVQPCSECATLREALEAIRIALKEPAGGEYWTARKFLDERGIYNGDLDDSRVLNKVAEAALALTSKVAAQPPALNASPHRKESKESYE